MYHRHIICIPGKPPAGIGVKRNATAAHPSGDAGRETTLQAGKPSQHRDPAQGQGIPFRNARRPGIPVRLRNLSKDGTLP